MPSGDVRQGCRRETPGHVRHQERPGASHRGLFCRRRLVPARPAGGTQRPRPLGEKTGHGERRDSPGPAVGPGRLFQAPPPGGLREGALLPALRAGRGGACGLTGPPGGAPRRGAHPCGMHCVRARPGASRARDPAPCAVLGPPLSLLLATALVAHRLRGRLLSRPWRSRDNADALRPLCAEDGTRAQRNVSVAARAQTRLCPRRPGAAGTSIRVWCRPGWSAPASGTHVRTRDRLLTTPGIPRRKNRRKSALRSRVSLAPSAPGYAITSLHTHSLCGFPEFFLVACGKAMVHVDHFVG